MLSPQEVIGQIRSRRDAVLGYLSDLVATRTENPPGDEHRAVAVVEAFCRRVGLPCEIREKEKGRSNIIATLGEGSPRVAVICHLDTVPAGDGWTTDPFVATVRNGRVYGRGTKDDKGAMAAAMAAVELLKAHESDIAGQVVLMGVADEECGSRLGTHYLLEFGDIRNLDAAIVPDAGNHMDTIDVAEKGLLFLDITCHGSQAHGSTPAAGTSAIYPMAELALWLRRWRMPGGQNDLFHPSTATKNVGVLTGGSAPNMVPATCRMKLDMRFLPGTQAEELLAAVCNTLDRLERKHKGIHFEVETLHEEVPTAVPHDAPLVVSLASAVEQVTGRRPKPFGMSGATVAKQFIAAGIPAVGICPGDGETEHKADEYMPVDELVDFAAVLAICLKDLAGRKQ